MGKTGEAHLTYYAIAYNRVEMETNQLPQDLFISSM